MVLSGCAVGPDYQRPEATTIPAAYTGVSDEWKIAVPQAHLPKGNWWEMFDDAELNRLEAEAAAANQDLKAAAARFEQARAVVDVARSGLFPRLGISFLPTWQHDSENRPAGGKPGQTYDTYTVPFDLSYELDLWGRVRRTIESATAQAQASADDVESVRLAIQAEVAADYFAVRTLDADKALLLSSIEVYRKSLELVRNRRAGGMVSDLDVAQSETVLKTTEAQLPDTVLQRAKFQHALAVLTGNNASLFRLDGATARPGAVHYSRRPALRAARTPARHRRGRTAHGRRQRQHRRGQGGILSDHQVQRPGRFSKRRYGDAV